MHGMKILPLKYQLMNFSGKKQANDATINLKSALMISGIYLGLLAPLAVHSINKAMKKPYLTDTDKFKSTMHKARSMFFKAPLIAVSAVCIESFRQPRGLSKL